MGLIINPYRFGGGGGGGGDPTTLVYEIDVEDGTPGSAYSPTLPSGVTLGAAFGAPPWCISNHGESASQSMRYPSSTEYGGGNNSLYRVYSIWQYSYLSAQGVMPGPGRSTHFIWFAQDGSPKTYSSGGSTWYASAFWFYESGGAGIYVVLYDATTLGIINKPTGGYTSGLTPDATLDITGYTGKNELHKVDIVWEEGSNKDFKLTWDDGPTITQNFGTIASSKILYLCNIGNATAVSSSTSYFASVDSMQVFKV